MRLTVALAMLAVALGVAPVPGSSRGQPHTSAHAGDTGQRIVTGMAGRRPSARLLRRVREGEVGGVILFGWNVTSGAQARSAIAALQRAARRGGQPPLLVMTDQEGGAVKRFGWLPPAYSARRMGRNPELAGREGGRTGRALRGLGVNVDLAPVGDVPHSASHFLGSRAFGRRADGVAAAAGAFARGLGSAGVAGTAKHFPGLGYARANTDFSRVRIRAPRAAIRADYEPFEAMVQAGIPLVMLSNAAYDALDPRGRPACMSRPIVEGELRGVAGFTGVTISDALGSPAVARTPNAYIEVANSGVDLLLLGTERASEAAYRALLASARRGALDARRHAAAVGRIRALKGALGR
jgi:beta-N-acetylhexosaminidase